MTDEATAIAEQTETTTQVSENRTGETSIDLFTKAPDKLPDFASIVPEAYKADESIQNILKTENPTEEFFKSYTNAQKLIGSRLQVPAEDAKEEDWNKFYRQIGSPDDPTKYSINPTKLEGPDAELATFIHNSRPKEFMDKIATAGVKWGLTQRQLQGMMEDHDKAVIDLNKQELQNQASLASKQLEDNKQKDVEFEAMAKGAFGNQWEKVLERGKTFLETNVPQADRAGLTELDNKSLMLVAKALNNFIPKYTKEDTINNRHLSGMTPDNAREAGRKLMDHPAFRDVMHQDHEKVVNAWRASFGLPPK